MNMELEHLDAVAHKVAELAKQHPYVAFGISFYLASLAVSSFKNLGRPRPTKLNGPPSKSVIFGQSIEVLKSEDSAAMYEEWVRTYGSVFQLPLGLGRKATVLCDPAAVASMFSKDTTVYHQPTSLATFFAANFGKNILVVDGEDHKRQRRALSSGFSIAAIRNLMPVFYKSTNAVKINWDLAIQSSHENVAKIDVQAWMNNITLDSICMGGFSHDPGATRGETSSIATYFDMFADLKPSLASAASFLLNPFFPPLAKLPTERRKLNLSLVGSFKEIGIQVWAKAKREKAIGIDDDIEKSILGALVRSETGSSKIRMNLDEIKAQNLFMIAGYETTAASLTWALIELARNPAIQRKLREELSLFPNQEITYEQLGSDLPYLDAVVCETLRLHPPLQERSRTANEDDILPLSEPIIDALGNAIENIVLPKGTPIVVPIGAINRLEGLWGKNSHAFDPERWIDDKVSLEKAATIQGYRHLLTFADGPRTCLGRQFALTEIKAVLSVLVRDYAFELPSGPTAKITISRGLLLRPKVAGEEGARVPLLITRA